MGKNKTPDNSSSDSAVHVGSGSKNRKNRLLVATSVVICVVTAGAIGVGVRWWQERGAEPQQLAKLPKVVNDVQNLRLSGDVGAADKKISEALKNPSLDKQTRYDLYVQQGHSFVDKKNYTEAIKAYKAAEKVVSTYSVAWLLGDMYRKVGDTKQAIAYYNKAIELVPASEPLADAERGYLQTIVKDLEAGQGS